jgi:hypothetical protein
MQLSITSLSKCRSPVIWRRTVTKLPMYIPGRCECVLPI